MLCAGYRSAAVPPGGFAPPPPIRNDAHVRCSADAQTAAGIRVRASRSTLPMASLVMPVRADLHPSIGSPVVADTLTHEVPTDPDMAAAVPTPEPRRPDKSGSRRRYDLDLRWRRRNVDVDDDRSIAGARSRHGGRGH